MELYPLDIVIHIINIAVLYLLLRSLLDRPVSAYLGARSARIEEELATAQKTRQQADEVKRQLEERLESAEEEARAIVRKEEEKAAEESARLLADARKGADEIMAAAAGRIAQEKALAMSSMREETAQLATEIAARILRREVSLEDNRAVVSNFFSEMEKQ